MSTRPHQDERLGDRIRRRRLEKKLGLREAAGLLAISPTYLSRIETSEEKTPPTEEVIQRIAALLEDSFDELMTLAGRIPRDLAEYIASDPGLPQFLRTARDSNVTSAELAAWLKGRRKRS